MGTTDENLIQRCQTGDHASFRQLYRRYQNRVRSTLYQLCGAELLDDLVQDVFLRVWRALPKLQHPSQFSTWLYRITWNVATDQRRKYALTPPQKSMDDEEQTLTQIPSRSLDNLDLMTLHYQELVQQALQALSFDHRTVLVLHDLEDLPQKEISAIVGIPVGTVKSRLFHARSSLRQYLIQQGVSL